MEWALKFSLTRTLFSMMIAMTLTRFACAENQIDLAGRWQFALDRDDAGVHKQWFNATLSDQVQLPGSLQAQGFGDPPTADTQWTAGIGSKLLAQPKFAAYTKASDFKTPFWLTPPRHYVGAAWYQRDIDIPNGWKDRRVVLFLQRPHWETTVWVDDALIGTQNSLGTPHEYDLTALATAGKHRLTIRVDNQVKIPVGNDAHSISDQTQSNWNGIVGDIKLMTTAKTWIDDVQVYPNVAGHKVKLSLDIGDLSKVGGDGVLSIRAQSRNAGKPQTTAVKEFPVKWNDGHTKVDLEYELGADAQRWDEFSPALYDLAIDLKSDGVAMDSRTITFGLREISTTKHQFAINRRPIFLRGTLECCIFPLTGYPPTDVDSWKRILTIARAHGLNHLRFHSWCPPEAAFVAADEMGFYYQVECSCWADFSGDSPVEEWVYEEGERMLRAYGNHPSFILMAASNEPSRNKSDAFLTEWVKHFKQLDRRRKYTSGSGWPQLDVNDYNVMAQPRMHNSKELSRAPQTLADYRDVTAKYSVPIVTHEMGQWCAYPNFDEIAKYTGTFRAGNLEIFRDFLKASGMLDEAHDFLMASGKFQAALYKEEIEAQLRTPDIAGFQLLDLHDFPGQGTAPVGVLDAFWDSKGYISSKEYRRFCNQTVLLARMDRRVFTNDESCDVEIDVSHFGPADLHDAVAKWVVRDENGAAISQGQLDAKSVATGALRKLGNVSIAINKISRASKLNLEVSLDGTEIANDWDFWVYPANLDSSTPEGITFATELDEKTLATLTGGGKVLLAPGPEHIAGDTFGAFEPIFWNRITFPTQRIHTLGVLCDPKHPALAQFPTDAQSNWQWWDIQQHCKPIVLDALPRELKPIVQMIDDWTMCRKLGLVFEARVGKGKLIMCSVDLTTDLAHRLAARQLRQSLLHYMSTDAFAPAVELQPEQIQSLVSTASVR